MDKQNDIFKIDIQGMAPLLQVFDMPTSLKFYRDILCFKIVQSSGEGDDVDWVLLELNKIELMLNTAYEKEHGPAKPDQLRIAAHADTTLYFGCPDIDAAYKYLHQNGVDLKEPSITGYGWKAINFKDPDGFEICFHWPVGK